jgi:hypothetical protein
MPIIQPAVSPYPVSFLAGQALTVTNIAAAATLMTNGIHLVDLSRFSQVRFHGRVSVAGNSGSKLRVRYHTAFSTTVGDYVQMGTSEVEIVLTNTGFIDSGWIDLVAGAKANVYISGITIDGDGAADPQIANITAVFR